MFHTAAAFLCVSSSKVPSKILIFWHLSRTLHTARYIIKRQKTVGLLGPLVVLDLELDLSGDLGESVAELGHGGVLGDADVLELGQSVVQLLQVDLGQVNDVLGHSGLCREWRAEQTLRVGWKGRFWEGVSYR